MKLAHNDAESKVKPVFYLVRALDLYHRGHGGSLGKIHRGNLSSLHRGNLASLPRGNLASL